MNNVSISKIHENVIPSLKKAANFERKSRECRSPMLRKDYTLNKIESLNDTVKLINILDLTIDEVEKYIESNVKGFSALVRLMKLHSNL